MTGYGLEDRGVRIQVLVQEFSLLHMVQTSSWAHAAFNAYQGISPGVKWSGHEVDHLPPTSAEIKKTLIYTSPPSYVFMV
jgi:hypothetical protein